MKKCVKFFLTGFIFVFVLSCNKNAGGTVDWTVSDEEKAQGWKAFKEIGFKVQMPELISQSKDNIDAAIIGSEEDGSEPVYKAYVYKYVSDSVIEAYNAIMNDEALPHEQKNERLEKEVYSQLKNIFALATVRAKFIDEENTIEKILSFKESTVLRNTDNFVQAVCFGNPDESADMDEASAEKFKNLIEAARSITASAQLGDPVAKEQSLKEIKNMKFSTADLNGNEVTSEVFAGADITMVNVWATWCPPCRAELPEIGNLARKYAEKNCAVIGICSDVTDTDDSALERAKEILADANCDFLNLKKNSTFDKIYSNLQAYPTTLFFDKDGNVIGNVIVGSRTEADFAKAFDDLLGSLNK